MAGTIVVGYDGETAAQRALDRAIERARTSDGHLVVVAVAEMPFDPEGPQSFGALDDAPVRMIPLLEPPELEPVLGDARKRIECAGLTADYIWAAGNAAGAIVSTARERHAVLIVVGSHHRGLLGRLLGEDVAAGVRNEAGCEVLVVE